MISSSSCFQHAGSLGLMRCLLQLDPSGPTFIVRCTFGRGCEASGVWGRLERSMTTREIWLDAAKGVGILLVVAHIAGAGFHRTTIFFCCCAYGCFLLVNAEIGE